MRISAIISRPNRSVLSAPSLTTRTAPRGRAVDSRSTLSTDSPTPLLAPGGGKSSGSSESSRSGLPENPNRRTRNFSARAGSTCSVKAPEAAASRDTPASPNDMLRDVSTSTATAFCRFWRDWIAKAGCQAKVRTSAADTHCKTQTAHRAGPARRLRTRRACQSSPAAASSARMGRSQPGKPLANRNSPFW